MTSASPMPALAWVAVRAIESAPVTLTSVSVAVAQADWDAARAAAIAPPGFPKASTIAVTALAPTSLALMVRGRSLIMGV